MANATKPAAVFIHVFVALAFVLSISMARNIVDNKSNEATADLVKHVEGQWPGLPNILGLLPLPAWMQPSEPDTDTSCSQKYKVKEGETCYSTWTMYKLKPKTFYALNPGIDCDNLDIGQALCAAGSGY
ncbi:hypothetical protein MLD38_019371 [Melastoma candidum]|uniref:Uncharacterized protein n=1 Tax=Melastoma candidum TaxID=119954 RepID=A0ACB9QY40_9MYRT|nr:hypothetical protein MLD38_019371 [Melastoma candidum]